MKPRLCLLFATFLLLPPIYSQQSTTGPVPPKDVDIKGEKKVEIDSVSKVISGVPAYRWRHGCGPTALGMVVGYYDTHGFDLLFPGSGATQTTYVNQFIASVGSGSNTHGIQRHYEDYCLPKDSNGPIKQDRSVCYPTCTHPDNCIADFMLTSRSSRRNRYGWSWFSDIGRAFLKYVPFRCNYMAKTYVPKAKAYTVYNTNFNKLWNIFVNEINNNRPMVFLVDTNGDGWTDHFITVIGYNQTPTTKQYCCYNTWDSSKHWYSFRKMAKNIKWGIYGFWTFQLSHGNDLIEAWSLDHWVYIFHLTSTTTGAEFLQKYKASFFDGINIHAFSALIYDQNRKTNHSVIFTVRKCLSNGWPNMTNSGLLYSGITYTPYGYSGKGWALTWHYPSNPISIPKGKDFWVGVYFSRDKTTSDFIQMSGLNKNGVGTLCGVWPRCGVTPNSACYFKYNWGSYAGSRFTTTFGESWLIGIYTKDPTMRVYSVHSVKSPNGKCPANVKDFSYGGLWPDVCNYCNMSPTGRFDKLGWKFQQFNLNPSHSYKAFVYLDTVKMNPPICINPYGCWFLGIPGVPSIGLGVYTVPTSGNNKGIVISPAIRFPCMIKGLHFNLYYQAIFLDVTTLGIKLSTLAGQSI